MSSLVPSSITDILGQRQVCVEGYCYKLLPGNSKYDSAQYGLDVYTDHDPGVDENEMSFILHFADGSRRDGVGDLLNVEGIDTSRHKKNAIALFDHGKQISLPLGKTESPDGEYTVFIDPVARTAKAKVYVYQGNKGIDGEDRTRISEHALFCEQIFDMWAKRFLKAGSIGYQVVEAEELPQDWRRGIPKGLYLNKVLMLEASAVVLPANGDTVRKMLAMPKVCGKPLSPYLIKSLEPYAGEKKVQLGWEPGRVETKAAERYWIVLQNGQYQYGPYSSRVGAQDDLNEYAPVGTSDWERRDRAQYKIVASATPPKGYDGSEKSLETKSCGEDCDCAPCKAKHGTKELIPGGLASGKNPSDFDPEQLAIGTKIESEHTDDPDLAREIAMDHLVEDPEYYGKLAEMEGKSIKNKSWESFRTQATKLAADAHWPTADRLHGMLEQYHDGDIRVEELLAEFPLLTHLAEREGMKSYYSDKREQGPVDMTNGQAEADAYRQGWTAGRDNVSIMSCPFPQTGDPKLRTAWELGFGDAYASSGDVPTKRRPYRESLKSIRKKYLGKSKSKGFKVGDKVVANFGATGTILSGGGVSNNEMLAHAQGGAKPTNQWYKVEWDPEFQRVYGRTADVRESTLKIKSYTKRLAADLKPGDMVTVQGKKHKILEVEKDPSDKEEPIIFKVENGGFLHAYPDSDVKSLAGIKKMKKKGIKSSERGRYQVDYADDGGGGDHEMETDNLDKAKRAADGLVIEGRGGREAWVIDTTAGNKVIYRGRKSLTKSLTNAQVGMRVSTPQGVGTITEVISDTEIRVMLDRAKDGRQNIRANPTIPDVFQLSSPKSLAKHKGLQARCCPKCGHEWGKDAENWAAEEGDCLYCEEPLSVDEYTKGIKTAQGNGAFGKEGRIKAQDSRGEEGQYVVHIHDHGKLIRKIPCETNQEALKEAAKVERSGEGVTSIKWEKKSYTNNFLESRDDYENPLSDGNVPNANWKPGIGTVKTLRKKYMRGHKSLHRDDPDAYDTDRDIGWEEGQEEAEREYKRTGKAPARKPVPTSLNARSVARVHGWNSFVNKLGKALPDEDDRAQAGYSKKYMRGQKALHGPEHKMPRLTGQDWYLEVEGWGKMWFDSEQAAKDGKKEFRADGLKVNGPYLASGTKAMSAMNETTGGALRGPAPVKQKGVGTPVCANCGQWQKLTSAGYYDCPNECAKNGDVHKVRGKSLSSSDKQRIAKMDDSDLKWNRDGLSKVIATGKDGRGNPVGKYDLDRFQEQVDAIDAELRKRGKSLPQQDSKSLKNLRTKYKPSSAKGLRRRLRKSQPGISTMDVEEKDMDSAREMAEAKGVKFHRMSATRVKLIGQDESIDEVAKSFGTRVKSIGDTNRKSIQYEGRQVYTEPSEGGSPSRSSVSIWPDEQLLTELKRDAALLKIEILGVDKTTFTPGGRPGTTLHGPRYVVEIRGVSDAMEALTRKFGRRGRSG